MSDFSGQSTSRSRLFRSSLGQVKVLHGSRTLQIRHDDLTTRNLARIFHLVPETIILISVDDIAVVPDDNGKFCDVDEFVDWKVEGDPSSLGQSGSRNISGQSNASSGSRWKPSPFPVAKLANSRSRANVTSSWQKSVEIWRLVGEDLQQHSEHPINVTDSTADVQSVANKISQEAFGNAPVRLLNAKNLRIPDVDGTKGPKFWRTSKIIRAVSEADYIVLEQRRTPSYRTGAKPINISDTDSDQEFPNFSFRKKKKLSRCQPKTSSILSPFPDASSDHTNMSQKLQELLSKADDSIASIALNGQKIEELDQKIQNQAVAFVQPWQDFFRCVVCKDVMTASSNMVVPPCCQSTVACKSCLEQWLANSLTCPCCREELELEQCATVPIIRPLIASLANCTPHLTVATANAEPNMV